MMKKEFYLVIVVFTLGVLTCGCASSVPELPETGDRRPSPPPEQQPIGVIRKISDEVEVDEIPIPTDTGQGLFENDKVGLFNGGEGELDFDGVLILRLFNKTEVGLVSAPSPGSSVFVRMRLELGGFTGELKNSGQEVEFETPNGAVIKVVGTDFFLVYDPEQDLVTAGNFNGTIEIEAGGSGPVTIQAGFLRQAQGNNPPSPEAEIPFGKSDFEGMAREFGSPVAVVHERIPLIEEPQISDPGSSDSVPPEISVQQVEPETIFAGSRCPYQSETVQIMYTVQDEGEIVDTYLEWELIPQSGSSVGGLAEIEKIDDTTFLAFVGPIDRPGILWVYFNATDSAGNDGSIDPLNFNVVNCIG